MAGLAPLGRPGWRLTAALYPLAAGAAAINVFFASLIGSWVGWPIVSPAAAAAAGAVLGLPVAWAFAQHFRRLIARAEG